MAAKLTKALRREIDDALQSLNRAIAFIESDRIAICSKTDMNAAVSHTGTGEPGQSYRAAAPYMTKAYKGREDAEWTIDYIRELTPMSKGVGSDLVSIYTARQTLSRVLGE